MLVHGCGLNESLHVGPVVQVAPLSGSINILGSDRLIQGAKIVSGDGK